MYAASEVETFPGVAPLAGRDVQLCPRAAESLLYRHWGPQGIEGTLRILPLCDNRALKTGQDLLSTRPLVLLGMSPGNAYFTRKRIEIAVCGMAHLLGDVALVIPDTIATHTYRALGYPEKECQAKARANGLNIRNRALRAMERVRVDSPSGNIRILDWERDIASLPGYWQAYARVCHLFDTNERFRSDVLLKGSDVLSAKLGGQAPTRAALRENADYLLKEFAYFRVCRAAFGRDLVVPYYQSFALAHGFCDGGYSEPLPGIGWLVYEIEIFNGVRPEMETTVSERREELIHVD
jgi:tRNA-dependent cyclodipeptide synthase